MDISIVSKTNGNESSNLKHAETVASDALMRARSQVSTAHGIQRKESASLASGNDMQHKPEVIPMAENKDKANEEQVSRVKGGLSQLKQSLSAIQEAAAERVSEGQSGVYLVPEQKVDFLVGPLAKISASVEFEGMKLLENGDETDAAERYDSTTDLARTQKDKLVTENELSESQLNQAMEDIDKLTSKLENGQMSQAAVRSLDLAMHEMNNPDGAVNGSEDARATRDALLDSAMTEASQVQYLSTQDVEKMAE
ncbi:MAG: hypothetical protein ACLFUS_09955 [Candidatus Sumerlaeia bacterium]